MEQTCLLSHMSTPSFIPPSLLPSFLLFMIFPAYTLTSKTIRKYEPLQAFNEESDITKFASGVLQGRWIGAD